MRSKHKASHLRELAAEVLGPGVSRRLFEGEEATLIIYEFAADSQSSPHEHSWEHLGYVLVGEITIGLPDQATKVSAGSVYHIASNVRHTGQAGPEGATLLESRARPR
jgi:quercetin dioxygenase-like cupin family protein